MKTRACLMFATTSGLSERNVETVVTFYIKTEAPSKKVTEELFKGKRD